MVPSMFFLAILLIYNLVGVITIDILEAIQSRRSIHSFSEKLVPNELLLKIFRHASWAPNHFMKQPWNTKMYQLDGKERFVEAIMNSYERLGMIKNDDEEKKLKMIQLIQEFLLKIPHHGLVYLPKSADPIRFEEEYAAVCAFIQNAQLVAWRYKVGMLWTIPPYMHDPLFTKEIGLDDEKFKIAAVMQIGYPDKIPDAKERIAIEDKLDFISDAW